MRNVAAKSRGQTGPPCERPSVTFLSPDALVTRQHEVSVISRPLMPDVGIFFTQPRAQNLLPISLTPMFGFASSSARSHDDLGGSEGPI
jgi:hypothetical protein